MKYFIIDEFSIKHRYPYEAGGSVDVSAEALEYVYVAGAAVIKDRVLMLINGKVVHFEPGDENNVGKLVGFCDNDALVNGAVTVTGAGVRESAGWGLNPDAIYYAAANGGIAETPPVIGICMRLGVAISASSMRLELSEPIVLI